MTVSQHLKDGSWSVTVNGMTWQRPTEEQALQAALDYLMSQQLELNAQIGAVSYRLLVIMDRHDMEACR